MRVSLVWLVALTVLSGGFTGALAHEGAPSEYTYREDVRPIFVEHCSGCHRPGGPAPMSLLTYSEAVPWANAIKMQVLQDQMPPWLPADGVGEFRHTRSLTAEEIDILIDWVIGQTPEGDPLTTEELKTAAPPEWEMGTPDLVLQPEEEVVIGRDDYELTTCVVLPTGTAESNVASAFEVKPGRPSLVRRATIHLGESCEGSRPLGTWLPGQRSVSLAGTAGLELPAGASLAVELRYVKGWEDEGKRLTDRSRLGIRFSDSARPAQSIRIAEASHTFPDDVELLALYPERGSEELLGPLRIEAVTPDGQVEPILVIEKLTPQWLEKYVLAEPLRLPSGTELRLSHPAVWIDVIPSTDAAAE